MYTRRAAIVTFDSLRRIHKVCGRNPTEFSFSVRTPDFVRNFRAATERVDVYNNSDGNTAENQSGNSFYYQNDQLYGRNLGGFEQSQNPSRFYEQSTGSDRLNQNHSDYNYGNQNSQFYGSNINGFEPNQNLSRLHRQDFCVQQHGSGKYQQSESSNAYGNRGISEAPPQSHGGVRWENPRGDFTDRSNFSRSYGGKDDTSMQNVHNDFSQNVAGVGSGKYQQSESSNAYGNRGISEAPPQSHGGVHWENPRGDFTDRSNFSRSYGGKDDTSMQNVHNDFSQNVAGVYHSNAGNYQQNPREFQSGDGDNAGSVEVAQENQLTRKVEDLDEFTKGGKLKEAVELLGLLEKEGTQVDLQRYMALMILCGESEALDEAKSVHDHLLKSKVHLETRTYNQILEMYSKCGSMEDAFSVFDQMRRRNLTSWDIMISWLAKNDHGEESLELFAEFKRSGLKPDGEMFFGVFSACGVIGDTIEGMLHFESMRNDYGINPTMEHYVSIVNMLGNAGCLDEASEFIQKMPVEPSVKIWETLMKFCRIHGNMELGDQCTKLIELLDSSRLCEQSRAGLIPITAADIAREKERKKLSGQSLPEVRSRVREYRAGDRSHPDNDRTYELLRGLKQQMKELGYVPETKFVLHDVDPEVKEEALMAHSERLAAAQGFLTSAARSPLRIIKNLRVCVDCHNAFKIISKIVGREIVARDTKRFHHFRDGTCSCNDFW
ncbi:hypothetical protein ACS0TY_035491 [Phlomoides rotata]